MTTVSLPRLIVIKSKPYSDKGHAYFKADSASVLVGERDIFSTLVKIEAEMATINDRYVNLRFGYFNRYWHRSGHSNFITAESDQPQEDVTKSSCTLFEPVKVDDEGVFYLRHVQSGGRVLVDSLTTRFHVDEKAGDDEKAYLTFVDWNTLVKLPPNVSFKGDNGKYLRNRDGYLEFSSDDPSDKYSSFVVEPRPDGHVEIGQGQALLTRSYWVTEVTSTGPPRWVKVGTGEPNDSLMFWPIKIDDTSIALRTNEPTDKIFCCRRSAAGKDNCLSVAATTITKETILQVQESVLSRKIYNVRYQMEYARIFDEAPFVAGSSTLINNEDEQASLQASVTYTDKKSYSFTRSFSMGAGISSTIEAGVPFITMASITVDYHINGTFEWGETTTTSASVTGTAMVPVPAKSAVTVDFVGTRGTCNIPYFYTQEDRSSSDGKVVYTNLYDGIYIGISYYNFSFHVRETKAL